MNEIELKTYAKINLCLNILRRLDNNYHEISSLMQRIDLHDTVIVKKTQKTIRVRTDIEKLNEEIDTNTARYACRYFFDYTNLKAGADVYIKKNIPHEAGLGGSSSDAAGVINALDELYKTNLTYDEKFAIGLKVGCDVPFFFGSGTSVIGGTGDKIIQKPVLENYYAIIIKPQFGICTKEAYEAVDLDRPEEKCSAQELYAAYRNKNTDEIKKNTVNTFEEYVIRKEQIESIKTDLLENDAIAALMTGSGSAVFGIFDNNEKCEDTYLKLKKNYNNIFKSEFI